LLPPPSSLEQAFDDYFVWWEPRDVVGGDFYWLRACDSGNLLIVCDCTGHGVPGAFMTIIGTGALNQALNEHPDGDPAAILSHMNRFVKQTLLQDTDEGHADDGMELGICRIDGAGRYLDYAGARFSLIVSDGKEVRDIKGDKTGIGYRRSDLEFKFTNHHVEKLPGMTFYLYSDGIVDQIGGPRRRSYGRKRFMRALADIRDRPMAEQSKALQEILRNYQDDEVRRDDVTVVGFRL
jgi:serine phosphatase RsbU (regulator of sigma subunit)